MCIWEWQKRAFDYAWHKNMKLWWAAKPHIIVASTPPRLYCTLLFDFPFTYDSNTNCRLLSVWFFSSTFLCFGIIVVFVVVASYEDLPIAFSFPLNSWSIASFDQTHVLFLICGDIKILTKLLNLCHLLFLILFTFFSLSSNDVPSKTMHNYSQPLDENNRSNWRSNTKQNKHFHTDHLRKIVGERDRFHYVHDVCNLAGICSAVFWNRKSCTTSTNLNVSDN